MKRYWLLKTEPTTYSWDDLVRDKKTAWTGVRNYQARNLLRDALQKGDECFVYHSSADPTAVLGIAEVVRAGYPDPSAKDDPPVWFSVDIAPRRPLERPVTLAEMRAAKGLSSMLLLQRGMRLSVQPVTASEWKTILALAHH